MKQETEKTSKDNLVAEACRIKARENKSATAGLTNQKSRVLIAKSQKDKRRYIREASIQCHMLDVSQIKKPIFIAIKSSKFIMNRVMVSIPYHRNCQLEIRNLTSNTSKIHRALALAYAIPDNGLDLR